MRVAFRARGALRGAIVLASAVLALAMFETMGAFAARSAEMTVRQAIQFAQSTYGTGRSLSSDQTVSKSPISQDK